MTSKQYEELCRYFLARQLGIGIDKVVSVEIPNPKRPDLPGYKHQIDLYWETGDSVSLYLNIANAKWRGSSKVDQPEVLLLQQVKQKVAAHKAVMLTNSGFTAGAIAAAQDDGIALHIVRPEFDYSMLSPKDTSLIRQEIQDLAGKLGKPLYSHEIVHRAFGLAVLETTTLRPATGPAGTGTGAGYETRVVTGYETRAITNLPNKAIGGVGREQRGGGADGGRGDPSRGPGGSGPGYRTK